MKAMLMFLATVLAVLILSFCGCSQHRSRKHFDSTGDATPHYIPRPKLALSMVLA